MRQFFRTMLATMLLGGAAPALAQSSLVGIDFDQRSENELEVLLHFSGGLPEVRGYRIDSPPRLTVDLLETASAIDRRRFDLDLAGVDHLVAVESGKRTRLVFGLDDTLSYSIREQGNVLVLTLGGGVTDQQASPTLVEARPEPASAQPVANPQPVATPRSTASLEPRIEDIDFRRGDKGASRLTVTFDRSGVDARVEERGDRRIVADLGDANLPASLFQILDVSDFGTPMQRIVPQLEGPGVQLLIETQGDYAMISTLNGRELVVEAKPVPRAEREAEERERFPYTGKPITLNFQDIEVREVLAIIADFTGLNLVARDSVQGSVTLNLQEVPWDQALDLVLKSHGLASRKTGNVLVVAPAEELAAMERLEFETQAQKQELAPLTTEYLQVRYAKADELAELLRGAEGLGLLSERGKVSVDARTNTLLIQETPEQLEAIKLTLDRLDVPVRQVQIEARIVIARDSAARELGVNWGLSSTDAVNGVLGDGSSLDLSGASNGQAPNGGLSVDLGDDLSPGSVFSFGYLSGDILLDLELRALESEGKSQTISQPKVITANQKKAVIKQGQEVPYQEATSSGATNIEFKEAVLSLAVTPQITPDDRIIMDLIINKDSVADTSFAGAPAIDTNEIETQVLVRNGETVVLGGILTTEQLKNLFKTPFLGDIPVLGHLFRYTEQSNQKVELLVFITPKIIEDRLAIR
ncbi:type IV pilus assembly protein PilQ [Modicisalibacter ilicicola DSM 19980]|uniref:Type IV pilus assembly protein PilQ n=1 Tax=Modicisalibacter ilicicola DSM 19980 TaxID=1121942 RepID=A0A1M4V1H6_9GAMM|nr:type IV pilus secretin PilQ family protein [Halomonas ilicicola]SHE62723.1 type IV pilus assembly protein PilQ [Halomonas ilicicola DSM 19980]